MKWRNWLGIALTIAAFIALRCDTDEEPPMSAAAVEELQRMQGKWSVVRFDTFGQRGKGGANQGVVVIDGDTWSLAVDGPHYGLRLDPTSEPKSFDLVSHAGNAPGIYELEGDNLKMCWAQIGNERPTNFETRAENVRFLIVLKRAQADK